MPTSAAESEWKRQKLEGANNEQLDILMSMTGLEEVKQHFLSVKSKVETLRGQGISPTKESFNIALLGNTGTGKTTVARLYARFLKSIRAIIGKTREENFGSHLASQGVKGCQELLEDGKIGVFIIDDAYQLTNGHNAGGLAVLDYLVPEIENLTGVVVFIVTGHKEEMEKFFAHSSGIPSRFPFEVHLKDYEDSELQEIFTKLVSDRYNGKMKIEGGPDGLYARIVARRIGRGRGHQGFGNARAVRNTLGRIAERQAKRLEQERRRTSDESLLSPDGYILSPNDFVFAPNAFLFTKQDLLGPAPQAVLEENAAWKKLQSLAGLKNVKQSVESMFHTIKANYERELAEKPLIEYTLNKVFVGNPGTGKTTVAKLYGQILADLGFLSNGEVVVKSASDFISENVGGSEQVTKSILASTVGKVLVIDEAYMLGSGSSSQESNPNAFKAGVVDTIVAEVQNVPGDDRCILLLGYKEQMEQMFQNMNPGFAGRFPMESAFQFDDYTDDELQSILELKLKESGLFASLEAKRVVRECLSRARNRANFRNAGEIDNILTQAKLRLHKRCRERKEVAKDLLEPADIDPDFDRHLRASANCHKLFEGVVGCEELLCRFEKYQNITKRTKNLSKDARRLIPFSFLFRGPPGTGKTFTARQMGQIYFDMGFLSVPEIVECSTADLVGQYVGQTGPKTEKVLERALGKVLFVDEAYRLANDHFGKEALDQLVDSMTKPKYYQKLVIILAGYDTDINRLLSQNPGLTGRFSETISFKPLRKEQCWELLQKRLAENEDVNSDIVQNPCTSFRDTIIDLFDHLSALSGWSNGRDVKTIANKIIGEVYAEADEADFVVTEQVVLSELRSLLDDRRNQTLLSQCQPSRGSATTLPAATSQQDLPPMAKTIFRTHTTEKESIQKETVALSTESADVEMTDQEDDESQEEKIQKKLRAMGLCPQGFQWIKEAGGYRCWAGSHFVSNDHLL